MTKIRRIKLRPGKGMENAFGGAVVGVAIEDSRPDPRRHGFHLVNVCLLNNQTEASLAIAQASTYPRLGGKRPR